MFYLDCDSGNIIYNSDYMKRLLFLLCVVSLPLVAQNKFSPLLFGRSYGYVEHIYDSLDMPFFCVENIDGEVRAMYNSSRGGFLAVQYAFVNDRCIRVTYYFDVKHKKSIIEQLDTSLNKIGHRRWDGYTCKIEVSGETKRVWKLEYMSYDFYTDKHAIKQE